MHSHSMDEDSSDYQFRFVVVDGAGHYGYIQHVSSRKIIHPKGGSVNPDNNTSLELHSTRHAGALFGFDEEDMIILHISGKIWHPSGGKANPYNNTHIILHSGCDETAKFYFASRDGKQMSPYPKPTLSADWKLLRAFITPLADFTYSETYKIGRKKTKSKTTQHGWKVSAEVAKGWFLSAKAEYSGHVKILRSETWSEEMGEKMEIKVTKGKSVYVWQYVLCISQCDEEITFCSNIIGNTESEDKKPDF